MDTVDIFGLCVDNHNTIKCPFLHPLKVFLRGGFEEPMEPLFYMSETRVVESITFQKYYNQP